MASVGWLVLCEPQAFFIPDDESRFHECFEQIAQAIRPIAGILSATTQ